MATHVWRLEVGIQGFPLLFSSLFFSAQVSDWIWIVLFGLQCLLRLLRCPPCICSSFSPRAGVTKAPAFMWLLGIQTQVFTLVQQSLCPSSHVSSLLLQSLQSSHLWDELHEFTLCNFIKVVVLSATSVNLMTVLTLAVTGYDNPKWLIFENDVLVFCRFEKRVIKSGQDSNMPSEFN